MASQAVPAPLESQVTMESWETLVLLGPLLRLENPERKDSLEGG